MHRDMFGADFRVNDTDSSWDESSTGGKATTGIERKYRPSSSLRLAARSTTERRAGYSMAAVQSAR